MEYIRSNKCCASCKNKCVNVIEDVTRTPSMHVLVEPNPHHRKASQSELEMKVSVWGDASPPTAREEPKYSIDLIALEKANALRTGNIVLAKALNNETIKSFGEESEDDEVDNTDDDHQTTSSY